MKMETMRSGAVQEREDCFLKRLATWPPELPTRFAGLGFFSRGPGDLCRPASGRLRIDTPSVAGWGRKALSSRPTGNTSGACAPLSFAQLARVARKLVIQGADW